MTLSGKKILAHNLIEASDTVDFYDNDEIQTVAIPNVDHERCPECGTRGYLDFMDSDWSDGKSNEKVFFYKCSYAVKGRDGFFEKCPGRFKFVVKR